MPRVLLGALAWALLATEASAATGVVYAPQASSGLVDVARELDPSLTWVRLAPGSGKGIIDPLPDPAQLESAYVEADFVGCLQRLSSGRIEPLTPAQRHVAAKLLALGAACAFGARDIARASELLRRLFVQDLPSAQALSRLPPDVQALAEEVRAQVLAQGRGRLSVESEPATASVRMNGAVVGQTPCAVAARKGSHQLRIEALGFWPHRQTVALTRTATVSVRLSLANEEHLRRQLRRAPVDARGSPSAAAAIARVHGAARVVVVSRGGSRRWTATRYDAAEGRVVAVTEAAEAADALRLSLAPPLDAADDAGDDGWVASPWLWVGVGAVVVAASVTGALFATRDRRFDVELWTP